MTKEHLPECPCNHADERGCFLISAETDRCVDCICPQLRACEQRVRARYSAYLNADDEGSYAAGFRDALDAAREAVERVSSLLQPLGPALAAIDALRGKP